jgi:hydroxyacylglutathione hydrolase
MAFVHALSSSHCSVHIVPALSDNFTYLIVDTASKVAGVIDPVEPQKLIDTAAALGVEIKYVLTTHSHWDHHGGNNDIVKLLPNIEEVYGGVGDGVDACTKEVTDGDSFNLGSLEVKVMFTPCHTPGHVCYVIDTKDGPPIAFTGDTLFVSGCGNFNTGTPQQMHDGFAKLSTLPPETLVYVGHEYTVSNLQYANFVEPENTQLQQKLEWAIEHTKQGGMTVPSTIEEELLLNPFMRAVTQEPTVMAHCGTEDPVAAMKFVREEKSGGAWKNVQEQKGRI